MLSRIQRFALIMLVGCTFLATTACENDEEQATATAEEYATYDSIGLTKTMHSVVTEADQQALDDYFGDDDDLPVYIEPLEQAALDTLRDQISVEITELSQEGDIIFVDATVTAPDADAVEEVVGTALMTGLSGMEDASKDESTDAVKENLVQYLENQDLESTTAERRIELHKEGGKWLVLAHMETRLAVEPMIEEGINHSRNSDDDKAREILEEVKAMVADKDIPQLESEIQGFEAYILYSEGLAFQNDFENKKAIERYQKIVDGGFTDAQTEFDMENLHEQLDELKEKQALAEAQEAYMEHIEFSDVEYLTSLGDRIEGTATNNGDKTVDRLLLLATLLDSDGNQVHEKRGSVVMAHGDEDRQLKPGDTEDFRISLHDAPDSWEDNFELNIRELTFPED